MENFKNKIRRALIEKNACIHNEYTQYKRINNPSPVKTAWIVFKLNLHYRIFKRTNRLLIRSAPCLQGAESGKSQRNKPDELVKSLSEYDVVSFDIFDTLILRPFAKPTDLFYILEKRLKIDGFHDLRIEAEAQARQESVKNRGHSEISINDIYDVLNKKIPIDKKRAIEEELRTELDYCKPNPYMKRVFDSLKKNGKKIIITSDMYLPSQMLNSLLHASGYEGYSKLFVSCDNACSKSDEKLYKIILSTFPGCSVIHVGDNIGADVTIPRKLNISSVHYESCNDIGAMYRAENKSIASSLYTGIVNIKLHNGDEIFSQSYEFGYVYAGILLAHDYLNSAKKEATDLSETVSENAISSETKNKIQDLAISLASTPYTFEDIMIGATDFAKTYLSYARNDTFLQNIPEDTVNSILNFISNARKRP